MKDENASFADIIGRASQMPEDSGQGASVDLPQLFQLPIPKDDILVDNEGPPDPQRIKGLPRYKLEVHFRRFVMGPIVRMVSGEVQVDELDDTMLYEETQNLCAQGKAVLCWEKINFLKDGGVVIAMKWMTKTPRSRYQLGLDLDGAGGPHSDRDDET